MRMLLPFAFIIPFIILGYLISKLDKFLKNQALASDEDKKCITAVVLGQTKLAEQIVELLEQDRIRVIHLREPLLIKREQNLHYLFALSEDDEDNIVLCKVGKKVYNIESMIGVCNEQRNEGIFLSERIQYLLSENAEAQLLYNTIVQETEMKS